MKKFQNIGDILPIVREKNLKEEIYHMHASRAGPFNSNEIYTAINEKERNPRIKRIFGVLHPYGTVSKFLDYWIAGLDKEITKSLLEKLEFKEGNIYNKNDELDIKIANKLAMKVTGEWNNFVEALFGTLYKGHYEEDLKRCGFNKEDYESLLKKREDKVVTLEEAMVDISMSVLNTLFFNNKLPSIGIRYFNPKDISKMNIKFVPIDELEEESKRLIQKRKRVYEISYNSILKELKSFNGRFPNECQLEKILSRCRRKESIFKNLSISIEEIKKRYNAKNSEEFKIPYEDSISMSLLAYKKSICKQKKKECFPYIDGRNMIVSMFEIAKEDQRGLVLQEFIRDIDYSIYFDLIKNFPDLDISISSCKTWDREKFPEFDKNLVLGLKYLKAR